MSMPPDSEKVKQIKKDALDRFYKQLDAAYEHKTRSSGPDAVKAQQDIDKLLSTIRDMEKDLNVTASPESDYSAYYKLWQEQMPEIDFCTARNAFESVLQQKLKSKAGEALFLIDKSTEMGGQWCSQAIEYALRDIAGKDIAGKKNWRSPLKFGYRPGRSRVQDDFIHMLMQREGMQTVEGDMPLPKLIDQMCASLVCGDVFYIEITLESIDPHDNFLTWYAQDFWTPLVQKLKTLRHNLPLIRIVTVVVVKTPLDKKTCLPSALRCTKTKFNGQKYLPLTLQKWKQDEIETWLMLHSNLLRLPNVNVSPDELRDMAKSIYQVSKGQPLMAHHELMSNMTSVLQSA